MAIDTGLAVTCTDLQATGGIKQILLRSWADGDVVGYDNTAANHGISSIVDTGGSTASWVVFEFKSSRACKRPTSGCPLRLGKSDACAGKEKRRVMRQSHHRSTRNRTRR